MSVRIKISYENEKELSMVLALLKPVISSWKRSRNRDGSYKKVYVESNFPKEG